MGYTVKWINDNLGITRDMLRHYEKERLLPKNQNSQYRNFNDEDIERIWGIKLLIGIGFSTKEIRMLMNDPEYDFDTAIAKKVEELEKKHDENLLYLEFAKTIKLMGFIPTTSKVGSIKFNEFLAYAHDNWNFYDDPHMAPFMKMTDTLITKGEQDWNSDDVNQMIEALEQASEMVQGIVLHAYFQLISDMQELGYTSETVQRVVRLLHKYFEENNVEPELDGKITPQYLAKNMAPSLLEGDISILSERNYGKEGCLFIANALAYYGGLKVEDL